MRAFFRTARASAWILLATIAMAVNVLGAGGCFFSPRDSEPPSTGVTRWQQPNTPEILINNVRFTFEDRQIDRYGLSFRADWKFIPDPLDVIDLCSQGECPFDNYTRAIEEEVALNLFTTYERIPISLFFTPESIFQVGPDTARVRLGYEFTLIDSAPVVGGVGEPDSSDFAGTLELFMRDEGGGWALYAWQDIRSGESGVKSWGELRGRTRS